jgi:nucleotide-binding universal stress UspA family protein
MNTIVIGYDGSESADRALARVPELAHNGAKVHLVAASHRLAGKGGMSWDPIEKEQHDADLHRAKARLAEAGITAEISEGTGDPATVIIELSKQVDADLIVIGNEHRNLIERLLLGSVSGGVSHRAACDVLVVD